MQANLNQNDPIYSHPQFDGRTSHYNRNEDCEWLIEANNLEQKVRIEFEVFALEADANCNYDQVIVYDGIYDSSPQIARLCGSDVSVFAQFILSSSLLYSARRNHIADKSRARLRRAICLQMAGDK